VSLQRTNYGLNNEHLFYDVSIVVYCEGKEIDGHTHDEMFWGRVLSSFGINCVCKSRGSKTDIIPLALQALQGNVENVAFAMDRDYGDYHGFPIEDRRVLYTYGYSWENDILLGLDATAVFSMFAAIPHGDSVDQDLVSFVAAASDTGCRVAQMDIQNSLTAVALFDREKPVSIFVGTGPNLRFNESDIARRFNQIAASEEMPETGEGSPNWLRVFFGKACARLIYQWFVDRSQVYDSRSKIPYDAFLRLCILTMKFNAEESPRDRHYKNAIEALSQH